jgi:hypothetical protein
MAVPRIINSVVQHLLLSNDNYLLNQSIIIIIIIIIILIVKLTANVTNNPKFRDILNKFYSVHTFTVHPFTEGSMYFSIILAPKFRPVGDYFSL